MLGKDTQIQIKAGVLDIRVEDSLTKEMEALEEVKMKMLIEGKVDFKSFQVRDTHFHDQIKSSYPSTTYLKIFLGF